MPDIMPKTTKGLWYFIAKQSGMTDAEAEKYRQDHKKAFDRYMKLLNGYKLKEDFMIMKIFDCGGIEPVEINPDELEGITLKFSRFKICGKLTTVGMTCPNPDVMYAFS